MKKTKNVLTAIVSFILIFTLSVPAFAKVKKIDLFPGEQTLRPTFYKNIVDVYFRADVFADKMAVEISPDLSFPAENTVVLKIRGNKVLGYEDDLESNKGKLLGYYKSYK